MTTETQKARPFLIKKGGVKAKVWKRELEGGKTIFTADIYRTYKTDKVTGPEDKGYRDSHSFSVQDLTLIPDLIREVIAYINAANNS